MTGGLPSGAALALNPNYDLVVGTAGRVLTWLGSGLKRDRLDQEGDAPQSVPPRALLEPPRPRLATARRNSRMLPRPSHGSRGPTTPIACFHSPLRFAQMGRRAVATAAHAAEVSSMNQACSVASYLATQHYGAGRPIARRQVAGAAGCSRPRPAGVRRFQRRYIARDDCRGLPSRSSRHRGPPSPGWLRRGRPSACFSYDRTECGLPSRGLQKRQAAVAATGIEPVTPTMSR